MLHFDSSRSTTDIWRFEEMGEFCSGMPYAISDPRTVASDGVFEGRTELLKWSGRPRSEKNILRCRAVNLFRHGPDLAVLSVRWRPCHLGSEETW